MAPISQVAVPPVDELYGPLPCPLCGKLLERDELWTSPHWICPTGHSYSNRQTLLAELRDRGWMPKGGRNTGKRAEG